MHHSLGPVLLTALSHCKHSGTGPKGAQESVPSGWAGAAGSGAGGSRGVEDGEGGRRSPTEPRVGLWGVSAQQVGRSSWGQGMGLLWFQGSPPPPTLPELRAQCGQTPLPGVPGKSALPETWLVDWEARIPPHPHHISQQHLYFCRVSPCIVLWGEPHLRGRAGIPYAKQQGERLRWELCVSESCKQPSTDCRQDRVSGSGDARLPEGWKRTGSEPLGSSDFTWTCPDPSRPAQLRCLQKARIMQ